MELKVHQSSILNRKVSVFTLVSFNTCNNEFSVDILNVQEINKIVEVTKVPASPIFIESTINH